MSKKSWQTQFGFYFLALSAAFGLGNLWRFPFVVSENGGGAFILLYIFLAFFLGAPLVISELILGKKTRSPVLWALQKVSEGNKNYLRNLGFTTIVLSFVVLSYYSVISGWVLYFLVQFSIGLLISKKFIQSDLSALINYGSLQWALASVHVLLAVFVVARGVRNGIESWISKIMPFFGILVLGLVYKTLSMTSSDDVFRYLFYPDFSKLTLSSLNQAVGHVMFTLSLGFGTLVTFGSYFKETDHVPTAGFRLAAFDTLVSIFACLLVFTLVIHVSMESSQDPKLLFNTVPRFMIELTGGAFFGFLFFLCLYLASLNATIALLENLVAHFHEKKIEGTDRFQSALKVGGFVLFLCLIPVFADNYLGDPSVGKISLIEKLDSILINWILPFIVLLLSIAIRRGVGESKISNEFISQEHPVSLAMWGHWLFVMRWVVPGIIILGYTLQIIDLL